MNILAVIKIKHLRINVAGVYVHFKLFQRRMIALGTLLSYRKEEKHQYKFTPVEKILHCSRISQQEMRDKKEIWRTEFVHLY